MAWITGTGLTPFGTLTGQDTLSLMSQAATEALAEANLERAAIDGLLCGYSTTLPHLMLSTVFAEHFGLKPSYAHALQIGGASGGAMLMLAAILVDSGQCERVLVVAGENRRTGQSRSSALQTLAQVGHPDYEVPFGPTVPAYYGLVASRYMYDYGVSEIDLAQLAVVMRTHASHQSGAHFQTPMTVEDVLASKPIASPLKLLDCCPVSDGGAALIISREKPHDAAIHIGGYGQWHNHQHITMAPSLTAFGSDQAAEKALMMAGIMLNEINLAYIYDSFTITVLILLEEIGFAPRGQAAAMAANGDFALDSRLPLNTHGGLLSYGHAGVAGGMAHMVEAYRQLTGTAENSTSKETSTAFIHSDGGVMSSHISLILRREA